MKNIKFYFETPLFDGHHKVFNGDLSICCTVNIDDVTASEFDADTDIISISYDSIKLKRLIVDDINLTDQVRAHFNNNVDLLSYDVEETIKKSIANHIEYLLIQQEQTV